MNMELRWFRRVPSYMERVRNIQHGIAGRKAVLGEVTEAAGLEMERIHGQHTWVHGIAIPYAFTTPMHIT